MPVISVRVATRSASQASQPVLYRLATEFRVAPNLRRAALSEEGGYVEIDLEGSLDEVQRAIAWLHTTGLSIDAQQRSVSDGGNL